MARSFALALCLDPSRKSWSDINWWIGLHEKFDSRMGACDIIIASYVEHREVLAA